MRILSLITMLMILTHCTGKNNSGGGGGDGVARAALLKEALSNMKQKLGYLPSEEMKAASPTSGTAGEEFSERLAEFKDTLKEIITSTPGAAGSKLQQKQYSAQEYAAGNGVKGAYTYTMDDIIDTGNNHLLSKNPMSKYKSKKAALLRRDYTPAYFFLEEKTLKEYLPEGALKQNPSDTTFRYLLGYKQDNSGGDDYTMMTCDQDGLDFKFQTETKDDLESGLKTVFGPDYKFQAIATLPKKEDFKDPSEARTIICLQYLADALKKDSDFKVLKDEEKEKVFTYKDSFLIEYKTSDK